jgi:hypothetical protein
LLCFVSSLQCCGVEENLEREGKHDVVSWDQVSEKARGHGTTRCRVQTRTQHMLGLRSPSQQVLRARDEMHEFPGRLGNVSALHCSQGKIYRLKSICHRGSGMGMAGVLPSFEQKQNASS